MPETGQELIPNRSQLLFKNWVYRLEATKTWSMHLLAAVEKSQYSKRC